MVKADKNQLSTKKNTKSNRKRIKKKVVKKTEKISRLMKRKILKGPCTGWIFFCKSNRQHIIDSNPGISFGEIPKKISELWHNLSDEKKTPWFNLHLQDKQRYKLELANLSSENLLKLKRFKKAKREKDKLKPRLVLSPYMFFVIDQRASISKRYPSASFEEIGRLLGTEWNSLNPLNRKKYILLNQKDKCRYENEMFKFKETLQN